MQALKESNINFSLPIIVYTCGWPTRQDFNTRDRIPNHTINLYWRSRCNNYKKVYLFYVIAYLASVDLNYINVDWFPVAPTAPQVETGIIKAGKQSGYFYLQFNLI